MNAVPLDNSTPMIHQHTLRQCVGIRKLYVSCLRCGHTARLSFMQLAQKLGWDCEIKELRFHLRCTRCEATGKDLLLTAG